MVHIMSNWSIHYITKATSSMKHTDLAKNYVYILHDMAYTNSNAYMYNTVQ